MGNLARADIIWIALFLLAVSATIVINSKDAYEEEVADISDDFKITSALNYVGLGGTILSMGILVGEAGFGFLEWSRPPRSWRHWFSIFQR